MKRIATWTFYGIGALAIIYLALYAYAAFTGRGVAPGDPIHIFRKPGGVDVTLAMPNPGPITRPRARGETRRRLPA